MAGLTAAQARCINCKTAVKPDRDDCPKCGDPVWPKIRIEKEVKIMEQIKATTTFEKAKPIGTTLSDEQGAALRDIRGWFQNEAYRGQPFFLAGAAGTGKTTLARHLREALGVEPVFGAYTGKAAHVLRRKGVPASTIHSAIYQPTDNYEVRSELLSARTELADLEALKLELKTTSPANHLTLLTDAGWADALEFTGALSETSERVETLEAALRRPTFELNPASPWADADLIVLDEVSMVNTAIATDIESFGVPVLVLGDIEQLPPIEGGGYYTRREPDFTLEQVHRQALESPVYALATDIRKGVPWPVEKVSLAKAMAADQIIVWKNDTRWNLTEKIREKLGRPAGVPVAGDRVMCLVNNKQDLGIFNGQQFEVLDADGSVMLLADDDGAERWIPYFSEGFHGLAGEKEMKDKRRAWRGGTGAFTFAQVITCHKAQGSEWDSVYVVDQTAQMWKSTAEEKRRWAYTAVSRASTSVTIARVGLV
jgi:exodeoxyribonuclease-5